MKTRIISISLAIALAFSVGLIGCGGGAVEYDLTISSTDGGSVTDQGGPGPYAYEAGSVVNLVAEPEEGYRFVKSTGDVDTIGNVSAAITTITMDDNCSITANFGLEYTPMVAAGGGSYGRAQGRRHRGRRRMGTTSGSARSEAEDGHHTGLRR